MKLILKKLNFFFQRALQKQKLLTMLQISRRTLYNKISVWGEANFQKYSTISDADLDLKVQSVKVTHPNDGEIMLAGHLRSQGIHVPRAKLRASIHHVDPEGVLLRGTTAVKRKCYHVERANDVWHIDGNHKLIRWRMVVHGGIDGYSRLITFLGCHTNNKSSSVLSAFMDGVAKHGLPKKVCTDHGGENIEVWRYMMEAHSSDKCIITGSSTHNERIERLWRDVHRSVLVTFANGFRQLEADSLLDPLNEVDMYCLHTSYVPYVNENLQTFLEAWNHHSISTEHNRTPEQLFLTSVSESVTNSDSESSSNSESDDVYSPPSNEAVAVPRCSFQPCTQLLQGIVDAHPNCTGAKEKYQAMINVCGNHLVSGCNNCNL